MQTIIITSPQWLKDEAVICNNLFAHGLSLLHLRKPGATAESYEEFIRQIAPGYRCRIVLHDYYHLAETYHLHGIHLKGGDGKNYHRYPRVPISISCHSVEEIQNLPFRPAYCFLSPVFDSISKKGYNSRFPVLPDVSGLSADVIALGGITPERIDACRLAGFKGIAALGYIWEQPDEALSRFLRLKTPFTMSIAGFDPSSGAGISADLKTCEATGSYGLGICSAITFQQEDKYSGTHWIPLSEIQRQCELQFEKHLPEYLKIGLIENLETLEQLTAWLQDTYPTIKIIWDPILKASAGHIFHSAERFTLAPVLKRLYLITPNTEELHQLFGTSSLTDLQTVCHDHGLNILWKGGHTPGTEVSDCLITPGETVRFTVPRDKYGKHGTGCILSAALISFLAQGLPLTEACSKAQIYITRVIRSNDSKLGFHTIPYASFRPKPFPMELNLQYITAPKNDVSLCEQIEAVCRGGMRWVQLRMKNTPFAKILEEGRLIKEICHRYNALFIINDHVEIARQLDADGVHLGLEDMDPREARKILGPDKIIGATCNTWENIQLRHLQQVDYIGLGPFSYTSTKEKLSPVLGLEGYRKLLECMRQNKLFLPVFAIGGITETDIPPLMQTGIQGIALSGLIKNNDNMHSETQKIIHIINTTSHDTFKNCK